MPDYKFIGKSVPHIEAKAKVTGEAVYCADMKLPGMLVGKIKRSPHAFARIKSIDTGQARALPGVKAVITARNVVQFPIGLFVLDELPLADGYARFIGDDVAAVAAIDEDTAEEALELIDVQYEELTPVTDPEKAMEPGAPVVHPELVEIHNNVTHHVEFERGEGAKAFQSADLIVEDSFSTPIASPAYLEPQSCVADWDVNGQVTIWSPLQSPFRARPQIAKAIGIPEHKVRMIQTTVGGGFGGKGAMPQHLYPITALLARAAGKPVKLVLTRTEEFIAGRPRITEKIKLRLGLKKDGTIIAKEIRLIADTGAYAGYCPALLNSASSRSDGLYRVPNIKVESDLVYTNTVPRGSYRGVGFPQMVFAIESLIDEAADKLGMDPMELRLKNVVQEGDTTANGWILNTCGLSDCIRLAAKESQWQEKRRAGKNRGIGMADYIWISSMRGMHPLYDGSSAEVRVDSFGKIKVVSGESDLGQGAATIFAQIVAEELDVPIEDIEVLPVDTDVSPFCVGAFASRTTLCGGNAVLLAARDARSQLVKYAARQLESREDAVKMSAGKFFVESEPNKMSTLAKVAHSAVFARGGVPITGRGEYVVPSHVVPRDKKTLYGNDCVGYPCGTQVAEVVVDQETGKVDVLNVWCAADSGTIINPMAAEGQVEGGVSQGIGYALTEEYLVADGKVLNPNLVDYKVPIAPDAPQIHSIFVETDNPGSPYGAKGIGEALLLPTAPAIANAIFNAVGIRATRIPITPEELLRALKARGK